MITSVSLPFHLAQTSTQEAAREAARDLEKTGVDAALDRVVQSASTPQARAEAEFVRTVAKAGHWGNSRQAAARVGLNALAAGGGYLTALAAHLVREDGLTSIALQHARNDSSLGALAQSMAAAGLQGDGHDDQRAMRLAALGALSQGTDRAAHLAALGRDMYGDVHFTDSGNAVAEQMLDVVADRALDDAQVASRLIGVLDAAIASEDTRYKFHCDKSPVARRGAAFFEAHGAADAKQIGMLLGAVLAPSKFSSSNAGAAAVAFKAIAAGRKADDKTLADITRDMIEAATNGQNSSYKFQADKSTVIRAAMPVLQAHAQDEGAKRLLALWEKALENTTFADTDEKVSLALLKALSKGQTSDRQMASLVRGMVAEAYAGDTSSYAYKDDKTGLALRSASFLGSEATDKSVKELAQFFLDSMDRVSFTQTCADTADVVFKAMASGAGTDERSLAKLGRKMIDASLATTTASYKYTDDKTVIALNVANAITARATNDGTRTLAALMRGAVGASSYSESCHKAADVCLTALEKGRTSRDDIAKAALQCIEGGSVTSDKQDQGPIAAAVFQTLSGAETASAQTRLAWDAVHAMMSNGADYTERVQVAKAGLALWRASADVMLDPFTVVEKLSQATSNEEARYKMLVAALPKLGATRGDAGTKDVEHALRASSKLSTYDVASESLIEAMRQMRSRPTEADKIKKMAERLNNGAQPTDPKVEVGEEYVVIGGVRVRKRDK